MSIEEEAQGLEGIGKPLSSLLAGVVLGGIAIFGDVFSDSTGYMRWVFLSIGAVFILHPLLGAYGRYQEDGLTAAVEWMTDTDANPSKGSGDRTGGTSTEKVPLPTEKTKNKLYFDRANQKCEWCDERVDSPDVHHIKPRAEGGSNDLRNLIVLCPSCHRKADNKAISRSKLRGKARRQMEGLEG